jgi:hypothetical protein
MPPVVVCSTAYLVYITVVSINFDFNPKYKGPVWGL